MSPFDFSKWINSPRDTSPLVHRDLSWLQFNQRVLFEAQRTTNSLLERAKFLAISASNLDEFFAIRVSSLDTSIKKAQKKLDLIQANKLKEIQIELMRGLHEFVKVQQDTLKAISGELESHSIFLNIRPARKESAFEVAKELFEESILPHLEPPVRFDPKSLNTLESLQSALILPDGFWQKLPKHLPQILGKKSPYHSCWYFFFLDQLLPLFLGPPAPQQWTAGLMRLTRDGEYEYDLADTDREAIPELVRTRIGSRETGRPIRLQISGNVSEHLRTLAAKSLGLEQNQVFEAPTTLYLQSLWTLYRNLQNEFKSSKLYFQTSPPKLPSLFERTEHLFEKIRERDVLLHHPYDSFDSFVRFIETATQDPKVVSIEVTIYRTDAQSAFLSFLKSAAKKKDIRITIELRARFDEWNNLSIASDLKKAGVKVFYGFGKLKLHAKMALVTRKEAQGLVYYTHLSTGNYHSATARSYTDLAVLTARSTIGKDARHFFDSVYKGTIPDGFNELLVAPQSLSKRVQNLIQREISSAQVGKPARIFAKVNALVDENIIQSLYKASQAGVKVDLVVRGACSLIPGIKGLSENIRVISILDFYLEHSRIYYFESSHKLYLSSADWMPRNFLRRLEIAFPILDERIYSYLRDVVLPSYLKDNIQSQELNSKGNWTPRRQSKGNKPFRTQDFLKRLSETAYKGTPLE